MKFIGKILRKVNWFSQELSRILTNITYSIFGLNVVAENVERSYQAVDPRTNKIRGRIYIYITRLS